MRPQGTQPDRLKSAAYMGHDLGADFHLRFAIRTQREYYDAEPPDLQRQTLARVQRLVAEHPNSFLARHWQKMYRRLTRTFRCPTTGLDFTARPTREDEAKGHVMVWAECPHCDRWRRTREHPDFDPLQLQPHCYAVPREEMH